MPRISSIRWPRDCSAPERDAFARIWKREIGADLWHQDYTTAFAIRDQGRIVALLWYFRERPHQILFARTVLHSHRGRGYANALLDHLIKRFPAAMLFCDNVNPRLTAGLIARGFVEKRGRMTLSIRRKHYARRRAA